MRRVKVIRVDADKQYGHRLKEDLKKFFDSESIRIDNFKDSIIKENITLGGSLNGYLYDGTIVVSSAALSLNKGPLRAIHESLEGRASEYHYQFNKLLGDLQKITNLFSAAAVRCTDEQMYRDMFPDQLWELGDPMLKLDRTREAGYMFFENKVLSRQFQAGIDLLLYHRFNKLVF